MTPAIKMKQAFDLANEAYQEELADLKGEIKRIKPKAEAYDAFLDVDKFSNFRDASKLIGCSQKKLMALLMDGKYIYKNDHDEYRCYAEHAECFALRPYKNGKHYGKQLMLTIAGVNFFRNIVAEQDNERRRKNHRDAIESIEYIFSL
jgi:phage antirepressor YoqD-like protein